MDFTVILYICMGIGIFFALPSTIYTAMFLGVFYRRKVMMLEKDDIKSTQYYPYAERFKKDILQAKALPCEKVELKAKDGVLLFGRYYDNHSDKTIICAHGYQSNAFNNFSAQLLDFFNKGYNVLLIDQRAHGNSGGKFTTLGCREYEDLLLWIEQIAAKKEVEHIIVYGISMGATTVGYAAEHIQTNKVKCLIMEAGFTCFFDELMYSLSVNFMKNAALNYIYLMAKSFLKIDLKRSVEDSLKNTTIPVLFLHGDKDEEVPLEFTQRSYLACKSEKKMITVQGAGHTLCYLVGDESMRADLDGFIDACTENNAIGEKE